ncbi:MAG TPA: hypothetical protein VLC07_07815 [Solirubrobacterales bacterium]|nr:hypothetical protein [Solirubrobacterales bacterium]
METDRPSSRALSVGAATALLAAISLLLLAAPRADAAAYYVGGGKGVKLAVRVVDRQIVWAKLSVRERCYSSRRGYYQRTNAFQSMIEPAPIGRTGNFRWAYEDKRNPKNGSGSVSVQRFSGRIGAKRLVGRVLYYSWFDFRDAGTHVYGNCRGGLGSRPSEPPSSVPTIAHRRPEPAGIAFYYGEKKKGIRTLFEVRGRQIIKAQTWARLYCTDPTGRRYLSLETKEWNVPIKVRPSGRFEAYASRNELPYETLQGELTAGRIIGSYGYTYSNSEEGRCRTGSFGPGHGRRTAPFVALRR